MGIILDKIAMRLDGLNNDDATTAERQIFRILQDAGFMALDDYGNFVTVE